MKFIIALGNPGEEYARTRHNAGRIVLEEIRSKIGASEWEKDKLLQALVSKGIINEESVKLIEPETFMNLSGRSVKPLFSSSEGVENCIVIHDEIDIPLGKIRISYDRSSGGHNGVQSIIDHLKTEKFIRIRVGICPIKENGEINKPTSSDVADTFILGKFREEELKIIKEISEKVFEAIKIIFTEGRERAMNLYN